MTLKKMSLKVLSVFLALIMVVGVCAPAVSAAGHDHDDPAHKVEINYSEKKLRDALELLINKLLGENAFSDAYFADYTVSEDSYYLAIGDDVAYAAVLAEKLGLGNTQYSTMAWNRLNDEVIAKADLITVSYTESMISGFAAAVLNDETVEIDWSAIVGDEKAEYVETLIKYIADVIYAEVSGEELTAKIPEKVENYIVDRYFSGNKERFNKYINGIIDAVITDKWMDKVPFEVPAKETVRDVAEAYLYGYITFAKDYASLMRKLDKVNPEATVVLLGDYNAFAGLGLTVTFDDIVIDLDKYLTDARQEAINDYVNSFIDKILELKDGFADGEELALDMPEIPGDTVVSSSLKNYINENLRDYIESFKKEDGAIDKEGLIKDIVETHGSIGDYIEKIEEDSGYTIEEWETQLGDEIKEELQKDEKFMAEVENAAREEFGESFTPEQLTEVLNKKLDEEVEAEIGQYRDEIDAALKVKDTYENTIKVYEDAIYDLVTNLLDDAHKAYGVLFDIKALYNDLKDKFGFEIDLLVKILDKIDREALGDVELGDIIGDDKADKITNWEDKLVDLERKALDKIQDIMIELGWIEKHKVDVLTLDLIYNNLDKLDAKTRKWIESFDRGDVTMLLGGLVVYSDEIIVWTEKGLDEFNSLYGEIADTEIVIGGATVDAGTIAAAPSTVLSFFYATAMENVIFVDISEVETGLTQLKANGKTARECVDAYVKDTALANATEAGHEYIAEQIYEALTVTCIHKDDDNDHLCDFCGEKLSDCVDENKDHKCDICGKEISVCVDENKDHKCDICGKVISDCVDENKDHMCDICGKEVSKCEDKTGDGDHKCDICGKDGVTPHTYGEATCTEPATCSECKATTGDPLGHIDENRDHICDRNCGEKNIGPHADVEPLDHKCDYCKATMSECVDNEDPKHFCDICGNRVSDCDFGEWEVIKEPTKKEVGEEKRVCKICGAEELRTIPCLEGLSTGAIIAIVVVSVVVAGGIGVAVYFIIRKRKKAKAIGSLTK